ncbi:ATPase-like, ParA/MinD [Thermodesulfobium narugense DSM 14796]|uniref:Iron-sulfur cluster carrier protein n=1 Tax=Thermodesulfobium narugense DSM 14796 TaxID=747365 RepID=M1E8K6_9BACT|nr:iron-sulfur cluster carrier protein MrpORP [Thermodesulfobium narugense]AEE15218.1 ATPase-like, ParA/MinD [Thermodesulfobium narugense DSM 14796]
MADKDKNKEKLERLENFLKKVSNKIMVMSGKGGVGKSTVAANLAVFLSNRGYKVGLLDVDVHGPSIGTIMGIVWQRIYPSGEMLKPVLWSKNLKVVSVQFLLENPDDAIIWRGPIKIGIINQFLSDVDWGELDYLIIDSPPGTGDEPLTIAQTIPDCKALIVTTPQKLSLADVRKSLTFCKQVNIDVLGVIENMSGFVCPNCGTVHNIFKSGGGDELSKQYKIDFLGKIPIDPKIVEESDEGNLLDKYNGKVKEIMNEIVDKIINKLSKNNKGGESFMRIAIPMAQGELCAHFGHCEVFGIADVEDGKIVKEEYLTPPPHAPGVIPNWLAKQKVNVVLTGGMGPMAKNLMRQNGIEVITGVSGGTLRDVVEAYLNNKLVIGENSCDHEHGKGHAHKH